VRTLWLLLVLALGAGCATPPAEHPRPPEMRAWAPEAARQGTYWRLYLAATDPACQMEAIYVRVAQLGQGGYPLQQVMLPDKDRCQVAGQLGLWLGPEFLYSARFQVEVWVANRFGDTSRKQTFDVVVDGPPEEKPPAEFQGPEFRRSLGAINIRLKSPIYDRQRPGLGLF
jgi:hypothetical protein